MKKQHAAAIPVRFWTDGTYTVAAVGPVPGIGFYPLKDGGSEVQLSYGTLEDIRALGVALIRAADTADPRKPAA